MDHLTGVMVPPPPRQPPPLLLLELEAAQRPEWAMANSLFNWAALLVPAAAASDATATPPSSPRYTVAASLPPSTRMAQRNATLDAFIALLPSNHQEEDVNDGEEEAMHSLVVTAGDGRRHYGFLRRVSEAAAAGTGGMQEAQQRRPCSFLLLESSFPAFGPARSLLAYMAQQPSAAAIEALIIQGLPPPLPGVRVEVPLPLQHTSPLLQQQGTTIGLLSYGWRLGGPLPEDPSMDQILALGISPTTLTRLYLALLLEKKVAIVTAHAPQLLSPLCEFLLSCLLPLQWAHACIPTLPAGVDFGQIADAPFPLLVGLQGESSAFFPSSASMMEEEEEGGNDNGWVWLDMDSGAVHGPIFNPADSSTNTMDEHRALRLLASHTTPLVARRLQRHALSLHSSSCASGLAASIQGIFQHTTATLCLTPRAFPAAPSCVHHDHHGDQIPTPRFLCGWLKLLPLPSSSSPFEEGGEGEGPLLSSTSGASAASSSSSSSDSNPGNDVHVLWAEMDALQLLLYPRPKQHAPQSKQSSGFALPLLSLPLKSITALTPALHAAPPGLVFDLHMEGGAAAVYRLCTASTRERQHWIQAFDALKHQQQAATALSILPLPSSPKQQLQASPLSSPRQQQTPAVAALSPPSSPRQQQPHNKGRQQGEEEKGEGEEEEKDDSLVWLRHAVMRTQGFDLLRSRLQESEAGGLCCLEDDEAVIEAVHRALDAARPQPAVLLAALARHHELLLSTMPQLQHSPPNYHPHIKTMDALLSRFFAPSMSSMGGSSRDRRRSSASVSSSRTTTSSSSSSSLLRPPFSSPIPISLPLLSPQAPSSSTTSLHHAFAQAGSLYAPRRPSRTFSTPSIDTSSSNGPAALLSSAGGRGGKRGVSFFRIRRASSKQEKGEKRVGVRGGDGGGLCRNKRGKELKMDKTSSNSSSSRPSSSTSSSLRSLFRSSPSTRKGKEKGVHVSIPAPPAAAGREGRRRSSLASSISVSSSSCRQQRATTVMEEDDGPLFPALHAAALRLQERMEGIEEELLAAAAGAAAGAGRKGGSSTTIPLEEKEEEAGVKGGLPLPNHHSQQQREMRLTYAAQGLLLSSLLERQGEAVAALLALSKIERLAVTEQQEEGEGIVPYVRNRARVRRLLRLAFRQALASPSSSCPPTWLTALRTLTLGVGGGWVGQEALKAFAVGAATWLLLNPSSSSSTAEPSSYHKAHSLPSEEEEEGSKKKKGLFSALRKTASAKESGHNSSSSKRSLFLRLQGKGSNRDRAPHLSPMGSSKRGGASYTLVAQPVDWEALTAVTGRKGGGTGAAGFPSFFSSSSSLLPLPPIVLNARAKWTRLPEPQQHPLALACDLLERLLALVKTHGSVMEDKGQGGERLLLSPEALRAIRASSAYQLFEAYACQLRLLPLPHNPIAAADKASSKHHPSSSSSSSPHPISSLLLGDKDDALRLALWLTLHNLLTLHGVIERFSSSSSSFSIPPGKVNSCKQQSSPSSLQAPLQEMRRAVRYRLFEAENEEGVLTLSPSRIETHLLRLPPSFSSHEGANAATASTSTSRLLPSFLLSSGKDGGEEDEEKEGKWKRQLALRSLEPLAVFGLWDGRGGSGGVRLRAYRDPSTVLRILRADARLLLLARTRVVVANNGPSTSATSKKAEPVVLLPAVLRRYLEALRCTGTASCSDPLSPLWDLMGATVPPASPAPPSLQPLAEGKKTGGGRMSLRFSASSRLSFGGKSKGDAGEAEEKEGLLGIRALQLRLRVEEALVKPVEGGKGKKGKEKDKKDKKGKGGSWLWSRVGFVEEEEEEEEEELKDAPHIRFVVRVAR